MTSSESPNWNQTPDSAAMSISEPLILILLYKVSVRCSFAKSLMRAINYACVVLWTMIADFNVDSDWSRR